MRALGISVYRNNRYGDCTNGGISSRFDELLCLCDSGPVVIDPDHLPENLVKIVRRDLFGRTVYHVEPYFSPEHVGWMMGGNYAATSDSRFGEMIEGQYGALAIHDRQEIQEHYEMLSR